MWLGESANLPRRDGARGNIRTSLLIRHAVMLLVWRACVTSAVFVTTAAAAASAGSGWGGRRRRARSMQRERLEAAADLFQRRQRRGLVAPSLSPALRDSRARRHHSGDPRTRLGRLRRKRRAACCWLAACEAANVVPLAGSGVNGRVLRVRCTTDARMSRVQRCIRLVGLWVRRTVDCIFQTPDFHGGRRIASS